LDWIWLDQHLLLSGSSKHASHGSLMMIVKGVQGMIAQRRLPYVIKKERNSTGEITLGLYPVAKC
jgi:hypothetical protein